jgi:tetratricopeptide (TPR) repeat protein
VGIVHRDIKPENVLVVRQEGREVVKIVDFGISAMLAAGQSEGGSIAGTPHYMPPEQILGQAFDGRCDQYATGCMAYELLVGHPPFISDELEELLDAQVNQAPPPIGSVRSDILIPPNLAQVIHNCLAKDAGSRYPNMNELEYALCEAQIADGLTTPWDDLALPEVDDDRREWLLKHMPSPNVIVQQQRRWLWPVVAGVMTVAAGSAVWWATHRPPTEQQRDQIAEIASAALEAGAKTHWVYPQLGDPQGQTSYRKVIELEKLKGRAAGAADERAEELRDQFAGTLRAQGDQFWGIPETKMLARDFYWQAWLFDQNDGASLERSGLTPGQIASFRDKAARGEFTRQEIVQGRSVILAAAADESTLASDEAQEVFSELTVVGSGAAHEALRARGIKASARTSLGTGDSADGADGSGGSEGSEGSEGSANPAGAGDDEGLVDTDGADDGEVGDVPISDENAGLILDEVADDGGDRGRKSKKKRKKRQTGSDDVDLSGAKSDPDKAKAYANEGAKALSSGRRSEAERFFNQAISYDRRNAKALMGLSDVYFDTGQSNKAVLYAERAVRNASKTSSYRLKLGDAYYKVLRYKDALEQYEKAKQLGSGKADSRIAKVKAKIGG